MLYWLLECHQDLGKASVDKVVHLQLCQPLSWLHHAAPTQLSMSLCNAIPCCDQYIHCIQHEISRPYILT